MPPSFLMRPEGGESHTQHFVLCDSPPMLTPLKAERALRRWYIYYFYSSCPNLFSPRLVKYNLKRREAAAEQRSKSDISQIIKAFFGLGGVRARQDNLGNRSAASRQVMEISNLERRLMICETRFDDIIKWKQTVVPLWQWRLTLHHTKCHKNENV